MPFCYDIIPEDNIRESLFEKWGKWKSVPLAGNEIWPGDATVFLLRSPLRQDGQAINTANIWRCHLKAGNHKDVKLIRLGFFPQHPEDPNYIDLLEPPPDLIAFLNDALPLSSSKPVKEPHTIDLQRKLRRFLHGHDDRQEDSLVAGFTTLNQLFGTLTGILKQGEDYQEAVDTVIQGNYTGLNLSKAELIAYHPIEIWKNFLDRFHTYQALFAVSPLKSQFDQMAALIKVIKPFFLSSWQNEALLNTSDEHINDIFRILQKLEKEYVQKI